MVLPIPKEQFVRFLCDSKRATYAAKDDITRVEPVLAGSCQLEYRRGALLNILLDRKSFTIKMILSGG